MRKSKMEELLNKLIEKGWKPFRKGKKELKFVEIGKEMLLRWKENYYCSKGYSYRELVSKESGLWQFVCENKLENPKEWKQRTDLDEDGREYVKYSTKFDEYRLIESALCDEDKLEEFLLSNIKIDE